MEYDPVIVLGGTLMFCIFNCALLNELISWRNLLLKEYIQSLLALFSNLFN